MVSVPERRRVVTYLRATYAVSERRACKVIPISRTTYRHLGTQHRIDETYTQVVQLSNRYPYWGYRPPQCDPHRGSFSRSGRRSEGPRADVRGGREKA